MHSMPDPPGTSKAREAAVSDNETITEIGAEGGSITLFGARTAHGWRFTSGYNLTEESE